MNIASLIVHLVSGVAGGIVGGSLVGSIKPEYNLGTLRNSIAGIVGGGLVGFVYKRTSSSTTSDTGNEVNDRRGNVHYLSFFGNSRFSRAKLVTELAGQFRARRYSPSSLVPYSESPTSVALVREFIHVRDCVYVIKTVQTGVSDYRL